MKRLPGMPPSPSRQRTRSNAPRNERGDDIDLLSALREQEQGRRAASNRRKTMTIRRPALRTGGRVRMDAGKSTQSDARENPISAPRYRRNSKPRNWKKIVLGILGGALIIYGIAFGLTTPKLALENVQIDGVSANAAAALREKLPSNPFGKNLLVYAMLHGRAVHRIMANSEPDFADASVGLRFPHTLMVHITQREPYAMLVAGTYGQQGRWILDNRGVPIRSASDLPATISGLVKIVALSDSTATVSINPSAGASPPIVLGKPLPADLAQSVNESYALMRALRKQPSIDQITSIQVDNSLNMGLNMTNHLRIKLGQSDQIDAKLALVAGLLSQQPEIAKQAEYVDVSYPSRPAMMPRSPGDITIDNPDTGSAASDSLGTPYAGATSMVQ